MKDRDRTGTLPESSEGDSALMRLQNRSVLPDERCLLGLSWRGEDAPKTRDAPEGLNG